MLNNTTCAQHLAVSDERVSFALRDCGDIASAKKLQRGQNPSSPPTVALRCSITRHVHNIWPCRTKGSVSHFVTVATSHLLKNYNEGRIRVLRRQLRYDAQ